jgi:Leucine-rich repeat (LRR) protein
MENTAYQNIQKLIRSQNLANMHLAISLLAGQGMHPDFEPEVLAIALVHPDDDARVLARQLLSSKRWKLENCAELTQWVNLQRWEELESALAPILKTADFDAATLARMVVAIVPQLKKVEFPFLQASELEEFVEDGSISASRHDWEVVPAGLWDMDSLRGLGLSNMGLTELPDRIHGLTHLESLDVSNNQLKDLPTTFSQLKSLISLDISNNRLHPLPSELLSLPNLQNLKLNANPIGGLPADFKRLTALRDLEIRYAMAREFPTVLYQMPWLERLTLDGLLEDQRLQAFPAGLEAMQGLRLLRLRNGAYTRLPEFLLNMPLQYLAVGDELQELPAWLIQHPTLQILDLRGNEQLDHLPEEFQDSPALRELKLRNTGLRTLPKNMGKPRRLRKLDLGRTPLKALPESIGQLTMLEHLNLSETAIQFLPDGFASLTRLRSLDLSCCQSFSLLQALPILAVLKELRQLTIRSCPATYQVIKQLKDQLPHTRVTTW